MGLDITAYAGLAFALPGNGLDPQGDILYEQGYFRLFLEPRHPIQGAGLPRLDSDPEARCVCSGFADRMSFCAGSYSGYGRWREQLAELAGYPERAYEGEDPSHATGAWTLPFGPFHELIDFSDCEGVIGPLISAKLAEDFACYQKLADAHPDEWFRQKYDLWRQAFEMASQGGAVMLH